MTEEEANDLIPASIRERAAKADDMVKALNANFGKEVSAQQQDGKDTGEASQAQSAQQQDTANTHPEQTRADDGWKAKYDTLRGKYDAEIPRLRAQITQYVAEIDQLKSVLQSRAATPDTVRQPGVATPDTGRQPGDGNGKDPTASFDPDSLKDYGEEFVQQGRIVKDLMAKLDRVISENAQLKGAVSQVESSQKASTYQQFRAQLAARVPEVEVLNSDPNFLQYLGQIHPITGQPLIESLRSAEKSLDVERAVYFFDEYKKSLGSPTKAPPVTPRKPPLSPAQGKTATELPPQGKLWTRAEIKQFYADKMRGVYTGRDQEADKIERDIFAAQGQGRIVG